MANTQKSQKASFVGMTLAVTEMKQMVEFYTCLFDVEFDEVEMFGAKLYKCNFENLQILFCPASLAQNTAIQNRHQLDFEVSSLDSLIDQLMTLGGETMGEKQREGSFIQVGMKDPDNNSIVLKQHLEN
ncbi:VOC family protein [Ekhidna sp. To15]|uniref:VOC family protein n=1 Tax=Ekhidna sp. To15 TaxID=3395267 RepID=UPI003F523EBB